MIGLGWLAAAIVGMAAVGMVLAVVLSPWVLLAWPACAALFGVLVLLDGLESRRHP